MGLTITYAGEPARVDAQALADLQYVNEQLAADDGSELYCEASTDDAPEAIASNVACDIYTLITGGVICLPDGIELDAISDGGSTEDWGGITLVVRNTGASSGLTGGWSDIDDWLPDESEIRKLDDDDAEGLARLAATTLAEHVVDRVNALLAAVTDNSDQERG